jgi:hypothetical protein
MQQMSLSFHMDAQNLKKFLEHETKKNLMLVITDNSTSMLSMRKSGNIFMMRIHRIFLSAGKEVLNEIAEFIRDTKAKTPHIRKFINENKHLLKTKPVRAVNIKTQGRYYDLLCIYNLLNSEYFKGKIAASITWGNGGPKHRARKRTLGSYNSQNNMIRINPLLDNNSVPKYFLEFVVYHEMLHADMGVAVNGARRTVHSREFKKRETHYKHYRMAAEWEKKTWG